MGVDTHSLFLFLILEISCWMFDKFLISAHKILGPIYCKLHLRLHRGRVTCKNVLDKLIELVKIHNFFILKLNIHREKMTQGMIIAVQGSRNMNARNRFENRDIISTMPDDILGNILSRLTMKEAVRSSVLGTKWRHNWTFFSGVLEFEQSRRNFHLRREHVGILTKCNVFVSEWERFMTHMSKVMKSLKSSSMQGLRICMDLGDPWRAAEWVKYAAEKDVQTLDLDFSYHFSVPIYKMSELTIHNVFPSRGYEMKSLCNLRLSSVDVSGEVIEGLLASCPLLESICVIESKRLVRLKVRGEALRLKHLELVECRIMDLDIYAVNLVTFRYQGKYGKFKFQNVPSLVEASFGGIFCSYLESDMDRVDFYGVLLQINVLKLELSKPYPVSD